MGLRVVAPPAPAALTVQPIHPFDAFQGSLVGLFPACKAPAALGAYLRLMGLMLLPS